MKKYQHVCVHLAVKPDVSAILMMENVAAAPHISPLLLLLAERQLPQEVKIEVALPKVETLKWAYTESAPRFMTPGTYPACPLPIFLGKGNIRQKTLQQSDLSLREGHSLCDAF